MDKHYDDISSLISDLESIENELVAAMYRIKEKKAELDDENGGRYCCLDDAEDSCSYAQDNIEEALLYMKHALSEKD